MDKVEDIVGGLFFMEADWRKLSDLEHEATCKAAIDLIQSQQALIEEMREALEWAVAEIEGRTRYDKENQFGNCLAKANEALAQKE